MEKRKNYFIDKQFQAKFIIKFCAINIAASLLIGVLVYFLNQQSNTVAFENLRVVVKSTANFILPIMIQVIAIVFLFTAFTTIVIVLLTSHRIAGPLFRLSNEIERIKSKDLTHPVHIRATDQLQRLASECEEMRKRYQNSLRTVQQNWETLKGILKKGVDHAGDPQEKRRTESHIEALDSEISQFKTE